MKRKKAVRRIWGAPRGFDFLLRLQLLLPLTSPQPLRAFKSPALVYSSPLYFCRRKWAVCLFVSLLLLFGGCDLEERGGVDGVS